MQRPTLFINYSSLDDQQNRTRRHQVASYIGKHYRNRSKPLQQREEEQNRRASSSVSIQHTRKGSSNHLLLSRAVPSPLDVHDRSGLRSDPFAALPIRQTNRLPKAIDYCMYIYLQLL